MRFCGVLQLRHLDSINVAPRRAQAPDARFIPQAPRPLFLRAHCVRQLWEEFHDPAPEAPPRPLERGSTGHLPALAQVGGVKLMLLAVAVREPPAQQSPLCACASADAPAGTSVKRASELQRRTLRAELPLG